MAASMGKVAAAKVTRLPRTPMMADVGAEKTLTQEAYRRLRFDIISGVFEPDTPLRLEALKERYDLSFSPLREALNRLHVERLVVASALRGFRVAPFSLDEMRDAIETRVLIDVEAFRRSIAAGGDDWEARVIGAFHALSRCVERTASARRTPAASRSEELEARHREFHFALVSESGSRWLMEFYAQLYAQTERYRRPAMQAKAKSRAPARDIHGEHRAIMDAALARNADKAAALLAVHYRKTGEAIEQRLEAGLQTRLKGVTGRN